MREKGGAGRASSTRRQGRRIGPQVSRGPQEKVNMAEISSNHKWSTLWQDPKDPKYGSQIADATS
eukprot:5083412-Pyramimonas_sp.AAC.1